MSARKLAILSACVTLLGGIDTGYEQTNLGDLRDAPSSKFTQPDFDLLWAAVDEVSRTKEKGATRTWKNEATGSGGTIKLLNVFTSTTGQDCRRLRIDNYAKSLKGSSKQIVCLGDDGKWILDADARPAPKPKT
ncbi:MAG: RT0821/Lpp0805 family surface protein [Variovorax sp.]